MTSSLLRILFALIGVSALLFAGFFAIGMFTPTVEVGADVVMGRPVAEVFSAFNDPFDRMDWMEGYEGTERISGSAGVPGSVATVFLSYDGRQVELREELKAFSENGLVETTLQNELFTRHRRVTFHEEEDSVTRVRMEGTVTGASWFTRSMMALAQARMKEQEEQNFLRLKALLEGE